MYDYLEAMKDDIRDYISEAGGVGDVDDLYEELWIADSVTGNGSGSYTFNSALAREYVVENMDLLEEALDGEDRAWVAKTFLEQGWETFDIVIRCHLLARALGEVVDELGEGVV